MDWGGEKIITVIDELRHDYLYMTEEEIFEKYKDFKEFFPKLFYTCLEPNFNSQELKNMLEFRDQAKVTQTPDLIRDTKVGEYMAQKYLYPVVGEPTMDQKKEAAKKVAKKQVELEKTTSV